MSEHTTHTQETSSIKRLERHSSDRVISGVAGGLGRYFDLSPAFFRLGFVVLTMLGGAGVLVYLAAVLVVPDDGKEHSIAAETLLRRRERPRRLVTLGIVGVTLAVLLSRVSVWPVAGAGWVLVLLAGLAILWSYDASRGDRRSRRLVHTLLALAVTAIVTVIVASVAAVTLAVTWFDIGLGDGVGDRVASPAHVVELKPSYHLGVGSLRIDLSGISPISQETHVQAKVGIGELRIIVPQTISVAANAHAKAGEVHVFGAHDDGRDARVRTGAGGLLVIDAEVGGGRIDIVRAPR